MKRKASLFVLVPIIDACCCSPDFCIKENGPVKSSCKLNCLMQPQSQSRNLDNNLRLFLRCCLCRGQWRGGGRYWENVERLTLWRLDWLHFLPYNNIKVWGIAYCQTVCACLFLVKQKLRESLFISFLACAVRSGIQDKTREDDLLNSAQFYMT